MSEKRKLNDRQHEAVMHKEGPLLIIAGAGTGKTTVITERVKHLINEGYASPGEILALSFTEKAAREMEERIDVALPYGFTQMWIMTFHSFCDQILKDDGLHIGINPAYRLITDTEATSLLRRNLFDAQLDYFRPLGNPNKFIGAILQHFSRLKDEDVRPIDYQEWVDRKRKDLEIAEGDKEELLDLGKYEELCHLYKFYQELKDRQGLMDFSDLIVKTLHLFRERPNVLKQYQDKFKYILVDEFQDTNYAQNQLVMTLAAKRKNLTVVADDDQSIYRWRGAAISNVIQFRQAYPEAKLVTLVENYRSTQKILDSSYKLIQHNNPDRLEVKEGIVKRLVSCKKEAGDPIELLYAQKSEDEADMVVDKIKSILDSRKDLSFKDFAILVRANSHAEPFIKGMDRAGIPYQFLGPSQLFHQPEVKDLIAYLKFLNNLGEDPSFARILSMEYFDISPKDIAIIGSFSKSQSLHLFEVAEIISGVYLGSAVTGNPVLPPLVSEKTKETLKTLVGIIHQHLALLSKDTAGQILFSFIKDTGMLKSIMDYKLPIDENKANNIMRFFNKIKSFEANNPDSSVESAVDWIELSMELGESPLASDGQWSDNDAVNLITIHSAKGLEFKVVFLVSLVSQRFPSTQRREPLPVPEGLVKEILPEGDHHLQEERRLFYVGLTRACEKLYLTASKFYGDAKRERKPSPFIIETLGEDVLKQPTDIVKPSQLTLLDWQKTDKKDTLVGSVEKIYTVSVPYLSYSQIQCFLDCPLHYKARYILKIPTPSTPALSFGNSIHLTLKDFYTQLKAKDETHSGNNLEENILLVYNKNWISHGYSSKAQEKLFHLKGIKFLKQYLQSRFDPAVLPSLLEHPFSVPIIRSGDSSPKALKIGGKIDRVDVLPGGKIGIIDYKTGSKVPTQKEADNDLQLSFYALAATHLKEPPFGKNPENVVLKLLYFEDDSLIETTRTNGQLEAAKEEIISIAEKISISDFRCTGSIMCKTCEYKMLCVTD
jgi:DNA helicase II / ATP-dependent DNA helicase PcrA